MSYLIIKSLHITAVVVWMSAMLLAPMIIKRMAQLEAPGRLQVAQDARRIFRWMTDPAIFLAWVLGLWMMVRAAWYTSPWMIAKLLLAVFLSALHGKFAAQLRHLANTESYRPPVWLGALLPIQIGAILCIALLVIIKPSL